MIVLFENCNVGRARKGADMQRCKMAIFHHLLSRKRAIIAAWCIFSAIVLVLVVLIPFIYIEGGAEERRSFYVRANQSKGVIIFVHGVTGDGVATWTNPKTKAYWPDLLKADPAFNGYNIFVFEYPSATLAKSYSIDDLSEVMQVIFDQSNVLEHNELIFLVHSMGGLITRGFLLKNRDVAQKVSFIYFYSTPTTGSQLADAARLFSRNRQFESLVPMGDNVYIENQQSSWLRAKFTGLRSFCAFETLETFGVSVVTRQSGTNLCTEPPVPIAADHISIVKPKDEASFPYLTFRAAFAEVHRRSSER
jgi:pimeloyl-ACP methyl ester carboxylesterase